MGALKLNIIIATTVILLTSCNSHPDFDITGKWIGFDKDSTSFEINIIQNNLKISGDYCAITSDGEHIDCWLEDEYEVHPINGQIENNKINIDFDIAYSGGKGFATLEYYVDSETLIWELDSSKQITYCPDKIELKKEK